MVSSCVFFFPSAVQVVAFVRVLEELWILNLFVCCRNVCFIVDEDDAVVRIEVLCVLSVSRYLRIVVDDVEAFKKLIAQTSEWVGEFSGCFVLLLSPVSCNRVFHFASPQWEQLLCLSIWKSGFGSSRKSLRLDLHHQLDPEAGEQSRSFGLICSNLRSRHGRI